MIKNCYNPKMNKKMKSTKNMQKLKKIYTMMNIRNKNKKLQFLKYFQGFYQKIYQQKMLIIQFLQNIKDLIEK